MNTAQEIVPHNVARQVATNIGGYPSFILRSAIPRFIIIAVDHGNVSIVEHA